MPSHEGPIENAVAAMRVLFRDFSIRMVANALSHFAGDRIYELAAELVRCTPRQGDQQENVRKLLWDMERSYMGQPRAYYSIEEFRKLDRLNPYAMPYRDHRPRWDWRS